MSRNRVNTGLHITRAIEKGSSYISEEFAINKFFGFETIFPAVVILESLSQVKSDLLTDLKKQLTSSILRQQSPIGSFNYWIRSSSQYTQEPYPDDLDDTFYAWSALYNTNKKLLTGKAQAQLVKLLVQTEVNEGGPYNTWLIANKDDDNWTDIDIAVNSNIAYFLKLQDISLDSLDEFLCDRIKRKQLTSPYYAGEIPIYYFLARSNCRTESSVLCELIHNNLDHSLSCLEKSLLVSAALRLKIKSPLINDLIQSIIVSQHKNGSWPSSNFYYYVDQNKNSSYVKARVITTAFCLEALSLYEKNIRAPKFHSKTKAPAIISAIDHIVQRESADVPNNIRAEYNHILERLFDQDRRSQYIITMTPAFVWSSLSQSIQKRLSQKHLSEAGLISFYGWAAYTVYDDVIDSDLEVKDLLLGNLFSRRLYQHLESLTKQENLKSFRKFYTSILDGMEAANYLEIQTNSFDEHMKTGGYPDYSDKTLLAEKSMGHVLGTIYLLVEAGFDLKSRLIINLVGFFKHFLIARQMNDDAHDWEADLKKGVINSASSEIFKIMPHNKRGADDLYQQIFWKQVVPNYNKEIMTHLNQARLIVESTNEIANKKQFLKLLKPIEIATTEAIDEREKALEFMKTYNS